MGLLGIRGKANNDRRYPGESNRNRPDKAAERRTEAQERQNTYDNLTPQQRIDKLDAAGYAAKKQRAKLALMIQTGSTAKSVKQNLVIEELENAQLSPEVMAEIEAMNDDSSIDGNKKKLKAKDRRARDKKSGN